MLQSGCLSLGVVLQNTKENSSAPCGPGRSSHTSTDHIRDRIRPPPIEEPLMTMVTRLLICFLILIYSLSSDFTDGFSQRQSGLPLSPKPNTIFVKRSLSVIALDGSYSRIGSKPFEEEVDSNFNERSLITLMEKPILVTLDFISFIVFASVGKASHSSDGTLDIPGIFSTALPFLIAWFATSPFTGVYKPISWSNNKTQQLFQSVKVTTQGWVVAIPIGCAIRGLIKGYVPPLPFVIVTLISTFVILGSLRGIYTYLEYPSDDSDNKN